MKDKHRRGVIEWMFMRSPLGKLTQELENLTKVLNEESKDRPDSSTERSYRVVLSSILFSLGFRTEFLLFLLGLIGGVILTLLVKGG